MTMDLVESQQMIIIIIVGDHVDDQRRMPDASQHCGREKSAIKAMSLPVAQHAQRATIRYLFAV
jgi:hypothetical protein